MFGKTSGRKHSRQSWTLWYTILCSAASFPPADDGLPDVFNADPAAAKTSAVEVNRSLRWRKPLRWLHISL
jgi:hypothetical protein